MFMPEGYTELALPLGGFGTQVSWPCPSPGQGWRAGSGAMSVEEMALAWAKQKSWPWCHGHQRAHGLTNSTTTQAQIQGFGMLGYPNIYPI